MDRKLSVVDNYDTNKQWTMVDVAINKRRKNVQTIEVIEFIFNSWDDLNKMK